MLCRENLGMYVTHNFQTYIGASCGHAHINFYSIRVIACLPYYNIIIGNDLTPVSVLLVKM